MTESVFNKVADWKLATLLKKDSNTGVACEYCEIFKNSFFYRTLLEAASEKIVVLII